MTTEPTDGYIPPRCDECGSTIQIGCLLANPDMTAESRLALDAILVAAHKRFHAEDRALAEAGREAARRMSQIGPLTAVDEHHPHTSGEPDE